jgi:hypothetical protein
VRTAGSQGRDSGTSHQHTQATHHLKKTGRYIATGFNFVMKEALNLWQENSPKIFSAGVTSIIVV